MCSPRFGGRAAILLGVREQLEWLADKPEPTAIRARRFLRDAEMLDLRIVEHLIDRIRSGRTARRLC